MVWPDADEIEKNRQGKIVPVHIPMDKVNGIADLLTDKSPITDFNLPNDIVLRLYSKLIPLLLSISILPVRNTSNIIILFLINAP